MDRIGLSEYENRRTTARSALVLAVTGGVSVDRGQIDVGDPLGSIADI